MNVLFVNACVREHSRTRELAQVVLDRYEAAGATVTELNLQQEEENGLVPFTRDMLQKRLQHIREADYSDPMFRYAHLFNAADYVVVAAPYWDLSFPASVKTLVEHLMVQELTFSYTPEGEPYGFTNAKRLVYVCTAGGPVYDGNMGFTYLKAVFERFFKVPEYSYFCAENIDLVSPEEAERILQNARGAILSADLL